MNVVSKILNGVVDFALPPVCVGCGKPVRYHKDFVCLECFKTLNDIGEMVYQAPNVDYFFSVYKFDEENPIQKIIHSLKYEQMKSIGIKFGKILGEKIKERINLTFDYIVPVPLHRAKERERKYNQSTYLCIGANGVLNIELVEKCLKRLRYTESQTRLSVDERKNNVKGAFVVRKQYLENIREKNIILVDDVVTTGSTILECASALKSSGCGKVLACALAKA